MVRGILQNSLHMRPAFVRPGPRNIWAVRAYNKYVTPAEKRLFLVRCGVEEYYYTLPDGMLQQMMLFYQKMLRVRAQQHLNSLPVPEYILPYDGSDEPEEKIVHPAAVPEKVEAEEKNEVMWYEASNYELTSDEALLFGDRVE